MQDLSRRYPLWLCDVWGVVHNGMAAFPEATDALERHRLQGGLVLLVTNAPRRGPSVAEQLQRLQVPATAYDGIVTSGDVTRGLIEVHGKGAVYHVGPPRDLGIFEGLNTSLVPVDAAHAVVCTGLFDDTRETPDDYRDSLRQMQELKLPFICANPDRIVRRGDHITYCAGAIADAYQELGGSVLMAGKPYAPIYELAMAEAADLRGGPIAKAQALAIGDGPDTDIAGASSFGIDCVLITGGIGDATRSLEAAEAEVKQRVPGARIVKVQRELHW
jgi:HAD superfamily hydrolase (TIGR01459 family)